MSRLHDVPDARSIARAVLANGVRLLAYETPHVQSVAIEGSLPAGVIFQQAHEPRGTGSVCGSALLRGTQARDFDATYEALESIGAELNIGAMLHNAVFSGKALAEDLPTLLGLLADALRRPSFLDEAVANLRQQRLTGLKYSLQDTRFQAQRVFRELLYRPEHPLHGLPGGTLESLPLINAELLRAFHRRVYGPRGLILVMVGAVEAQRAIDMARAVFEDWQHPQQPTPPPLPPAPSPADLLRQHHAIPSKTQTDLVIGTFGPSRYDDDYLPATIANSVLGEFGMMGRIGQTIREELGLAYYAYSAVEGGESRGSWTVSIGVAPEDVELAIARTREEIRRLTVEPISQEELDDNIAYFIGRLPLRLETNSGIAGALEAIERYSLGLDYLPTYADRLRRIQREDVWQAARRYLDADKLAIASSGPPL